jgi:hypothetical protein
MWVFRAIREREAEARQEDDEARRVTGLRHVVRRRPVGHPHCARERGL